MGEQFRIAKLTVHSVLRRRAASRLALPCTSSSLVSSLQRAAESVRHNKRIPVVVTTAVGLGFQIKSPKFFAASQPTGRGVQRHPRRCKMRPRNPREGAKIRKVGTEFKFGQLIIMKIIKIVATKCHILRLKCTKFDFGWGLVPDPAAKLTALPQTH